MSFGIAINLLTENFKRGTNQIKSAFRAMQMQILTFVAALGAGGIGLSNLVSRFVDVARETNRVTTALKNVSGSMTQYADNQRYLLSLAKEYGLEINALTGNYAKFTAAASISGMTMVEQRKIFESVSRAVTAFGMSADDSNGVFLALSQMMSKGKISSEELRLQMGERLPIALQAMAKAAGTSVAGLDKLLKQGKLMSADVLPKFAEALNEMIPNVDTNNLETSVNRLKNTFTELVNSMDIQSKYKGLVDWLTGMLGTLQTKIAGVVAFVITLISGKLLQTIVNYFSGLSQSIDTTLKNAEVAEEQKLLFTQKRIEAEKVYENTLTAYNTKEDGKRLASKTQLTKAEKALNASVLAEKKAIDAAKVASEKAAAVKTTTVWGRAAKTIKLAWVSAGAALRTLWSAVWPMALISAIGYVIGRLVNMRKEAQRIKKIFSEYQKGLSASEHTAEVSKLQNLLAIMNDRKRTQNEINSAQAELQRMLGGEKLSQEELNRKVAKRIELLKEAARAEYSANVIAEYEGKNKNLARGVGLDNDSMERLVKLYPGAKTSDRNLFAYNNAVRQELAKGGNLYKGISLSDVNKALSEYIENLKVITDATNILAKSQTAATILIQNSNNTYGNDDKKTPLQKQQESYNKQFEELGAQLEIGKITQAEYNKALGELNIKMYAQAKGTRDKEVLESEYFRNLKKAAEDAIKNQDKTAALIEFEKVQKDYNAKIQEAQQQQAKGVISQKELEKNIITLSVEAAKSAARIKGIGDEADAFIAAMQFNTQMLASPVKVKARDTTFDYKKSKVDIASETLDKAKELAEAYKQRASEMGQALSDELANAMANVPSLEEALKIAQVKQDVEDLSKELSEGLYSGVKDIASSSDRMVSAFESLRDVLNDVDASGWEKIMAIWNAMINTVDSFNSIVHTIENISALTAKLSGAKAEQENLSKSTAKTAVNKTVEIAANKIATEMEIQDSRKKTEAATVEMASKSTAAYADIPFVGVFLAAAQISAMTGMIEAARNAVPKFANGGIVTGGPTSGDRILARVNAGEMILNQGQQSRLFEAINSGQLGGINALSSTVSTKVRAKDIILTINNELKSQGKKPIS